MKTANKDRPSRIGHLLIPTAIAFAVTAGYLGYSSKVTRIEEAKRQAIISEWKEKVYPEGLMATTPPKARIIDVLKTLFEDFKPGGKLGIENTGTKGKGKALTPKELLTEKKGDCSDIARAFIALFKEQMSKGKVFLVEVYKDEKGKFMNNGHACVGVLTSEQVGEHEYRPFREDQAFRSKILRMAGMKDQDSIHFILIDPSTGKFGVQYSDVRVLDSVEGIASFLFEKGVACSVASDTDCSDSAFSDARLLDSESPFGCLVHGTELLQRGMYKEAKASLRKALKLKPNWPLAYEQLYFLYNRMGKRRLAKKYAELHDSYSE